MNKRDSIIIHHSATKDKGRLVKEFEIETYGKDMIATPVRTVSLMGLRVFCEQEMYSKIYSGEFRGVLIVPKDEEERK